MIDVINTIAAALPLVVKVDAVIRVVVIVFLMLKL